VIRTLITSYYKEFRLPLLSSIKDKDSTIKYSYITLKRKKDIIYINPNSNFRVYLTRLKLGN
jgi:hypothetical protein